MNIKYKKPTVVDIDGPRKNAYGSYVGVFTFSDGTTQEMRMLASLFDNNKQALAGMINVLFYQWYEMEPKHE